MVVVLGYRFLVWVAVQLRGGATTNADVTPEMITKRVQAWEKIRCKTYSSCVSDRRDMIIHLQEEQISMITVMYIR